MTWNHKTTLEENKVLTNYFNDSYGLRFSKNIIESISRSLEGSMTQKQIRTWIKWEKTKRKNTGIPRKKWSQKKK